MVPQNRILRTRLMASSRAFLSSIKLALLTLTSSRSFEGVGVMGKMERGGGVAVESDGESVAAEGSFPFNPFLPRTILIIVIERKIEERRKRRCE